MAVPPGGGWTLASYSCQSTFVPGPRIGFQIPFNPRFHIATVDVENAPERERRGFARLTY